MRPSLRNALHLGHAALTRRTPVYVHYGITHRCNLTCRMYGIWRFGNQDEELTLPQIETMAARLHQLGVVQLAIGGGEPFIRPDLPDIIRVFVKAGLNPRVLTNGVGIGPRDIEACIDTGLRAFSVSLDSLHPARFDYICGMDGAWEKVVRNMTVMAHLLKGTRALPTINCVVSHLNLDELPDMAHFARDLGFAISFLPVELLDDPGQGASSWEDRFVRHQPDMRIPVDEQSARQVAERVDRAYGAILKLKRHGFPILNSTPYLEASRSYLKTGKFPAEGCDAGRLYFSIAPNGQYTICHRTQHRHMHILDDGFEEYFHSAEYEHRRMQEAASCTGCMRACWIDTSYMFRTLQGLMEITQLQLRSRTASPLTWEQARTWARYDLIPGGVAGNE